jgi:outer membrane protein OmpA-like peptidoglycan-associated protein
MRPMQPPTGPGAQGGFQAGAGAGGAGFGAQANAQPPASAGAKSEDQKWKDRELSLTNMSSMDGSIGLLRTHHAGGGAEGQFRVGFMFDWFSTSGFLCDDADSTEAGVPITCSGANRNDEASHVGGFFTLSATPFSFLEAYASLRTYANSNSEGAPQLLQVLGDTTLGVKGYTPSGLLGPMQVGGEVQLLLLNGTGDVGVSGGATSANFRVNGTFDVRQIKKEIPIRASLNLGYRLDNSGAAVEDVELARERPISRIERFGLGINKVDFFQTNIGVEVPFSFIQPFVEWSVDVPVNRQGYECSTATVSRGDVCLGLTDLSTPTGGSAGFNYIPSRFGVGTRVTPFQAIKGTDGFRGLSGLVAFEVGTSGTSAFIEEVAPTAPWTLMFGIGYAFDVKQRPVEKPVQLPAPPPVVLPAPQSFVRGFVHETGKQEGVGGAIVSFQGGAQPPLATGADGRFLSRNVEPGSYTFEVTAPGFKPGTCTATVAPRPPQQPAMPSFPGMVPLPAPPPQPQGPSFTDVDCALEALPRTGNVEGVVKDASSGSPVSGAVVTLTDSSGKSTKATTDGSGKFKAESVPPGEVTMKVEAPGFMNNLSSTSVRANEDSKPTLSINKRPKNALVKIQGNELKLSDKILFETDSAKILGQSSALLEEIAEVLSKNPNLEQVEIQGHTDNTGGRELNQRLSDSRANAVRDWLIKAGINAGRLTAKGYGQDKPLAPNVTEANRARNRRVQFIIVKKK